MLIESIIAGIIVGLTHQVLYPVFLKRETKELQKLGASQDHISTRAHWIAGLCEFFPVAFVSVLYIAFFYSPERKVHQTLKAAEPLVSGGTPCWALPIIKSDQWLEPPYQEIQIRRDSSFFQSMLTPYHRQLFPK